MSFRSVSRETRAWILTSLAPPSFLKRCLLSDVPVMEPPGGGPRLAPTSVQKVGAACVHLRLLWDLFRQTQQLEATQMCAVTLAGSQDQGVPARAGRGSLPGVAPAAVPVLAKAQFSSGLIRVLAGVWLQGWGGL